MNTAEGRIPAVRCFPRSHGEAATYYASIKVVGSQEGICRLDFGYGRGAVDESNAHVLAAAADMLAALKRALAHHDEVVQVLRRAVEQGGERFYTSDMLAALVPQRVYLDQAIKKAEPTLDRQESAR